MVVKTYGSVYTDGCGSNSVSVSSPLRGVLQFFSGSTGVLSGKDWSPFRRGLGKFPYACPGISPGMARDVRKQTEKKVYDLHRWLIPDYLFCPKISWKKCWKCLEVMFYSTTFAPAFERESDTDGSPRRRSGKKKEKNFRKSLAVQKNSLPLRSRSERERQEKRSLREFSYRLK